MMKITYECLDYKRLEADEICGIESPVISKEYEDGNYEPIYIGVQSNTLIKVFDFCKEREKIRKLNKDEKVAEQKLKDYNSKFLKQNQNQEDLTLRLDLIDAALKLHVKSLFDLVFEDVAPICINMTSEEIAKIFKTDRDYVDRENYLEVVREFSWAFN